MKRELINQAKKLIPEIVKTSQELDNEILVLIKTATGCQLEKFQELKTWINQEGIVVDPNSEQIINFGSHSLKPKDAKRIISDEEYFEYLKS
jgi:hypothetical protein